jgi:phosphoribosylformylglycinamidine cyclo-ligase
MYAAEDYDLAGFCVGVVERERLIDGSAVRPGDALLAIGSSGPHSNGYSLIRKVLERSAADLGAALESGGRTLGDLLLEPTTLYCRALLELRGIADLHAAAHITGGGLTENLPRVLPVQTRAVIDSGSWEWPAVFRWLQEAGTIETAEMYRTFNCGVGMVVCLPASDLPRARDLLADLHLDAWQIGEVIAGEGGLDIH